MKTIFFIIISCYFTSHLYAQSFWHNRIASPYYDLSSVLESALNASDWEDNAQELALAISDLGLGDQQERELLNIINHFDQNSSRQLIQRYYVFFNYFTQLALVNNSAQRFEHLVLALVQKNSPRLTENIIRNVLVTPHGLRMRSVVNYFVQRSEPHINDLLFETVFSLAADRYYDLLVITLQNSSHANFHSFVMHVLSSSSLTRRSELINYFTTNLLPINATMPSGVENIWSLFIRVVFSRIEGQRLKERLVNLFMESRNIEVYRELYRYFATQEYSEDTVNVLMRLMQRQPNDSLLSEAVLLVALHGEREGFELRSFRLLQLAYRLGGELTHQKIAQFYFQNPSSLMYREFSERFVQEVSFESLLLLTQYGVVYGPHRNDRDFIRRIYLRIAQSNDDIREEFYRILRKNRQQVERYLAINANDCLALLGQLF